MDITKLVEKLQRANWAYRNTDKLLMTDDEYDAGLDLLKKLSPSHPFLSIIGAPPYTGTVILPIPMGSLDKIRHGEGKLDKWKKRKEIINTSNFTITGKLDGISALFVSNGSNPQLYLRGDGMNGVCVTRIIPHIDMGNIPKMACILRGELVLPNASTPPKSIGRSLVNGWVHRSLDTTSPIPSELKLVQFVVYQVIEPSGLTRSQQIKWVNDEKMIAPPYTDVIASKLTEALAFEYHQSMKTSFKWPLDGIVIGTDTVPISIAGEAKNPPDAIAYKAALDEQRAETTVIQVEWNISRQNLYIPRIQIEPVEIGGANIQWLSGYNAKTIRDHQIGPGARIIIRRSGDVIPILESVLQPCPAGASLPTSPWTWDSNQVHAISPSQTISPELQSKALLHALQTLGVEGIGPGLVTKLVDAGYTTLPSILNADSTLNSTIGSGRASQLKPAIQESLQKANVLTLMIASNLLPKGVGERKLRPLFAISSDPRQWTMTLFKDGCSGWTSATLEPLIAVLPSVFDWCSNTYPAWTDKLPSVISKTTAHDTNHIIDVTPVAIKGYVCFTGIRPDETLLRDMQAAGWIMDDFTKKTTLLVTIDSPKETGKVQLAKKKGIDICSISEFRKRC